MSSTGTFGSTVTVEDLERDPYPIYKRLRDEEPVSYVESVGLWLVTRWDDVVYVDKTPDLFTGETEPSTLNRTFGKNLLGSEGAYHERIRKIIYPWFRVGAIGDYPDNVITPMANEFVEEDTLRRWFVELATGAANFEGDPEKQKIADAASAEVNETLAPVIERLEAEPNDTLLSSMIHTEVDGERLTKEEIQSNLKVMIVGGLQAGTDLIALSLWAILAHPEQFEQVKGGPKPLDQAIEEA